ncbi:MAG: hypothetical protein ACFFBV_09125 [Promethearchaeota archaeon]
MGLNVLNKKFQVSENEIELSEDHINISNLIIPFSLVFKEYTPPDIYNGEETIPFKERDSKFQQILLNEFLLD